MSDSDPSYQGFAAMTGLKLWKGLEKVGVFSDGLAPEIRPLSTIPCPACGKIAWDGLGNPDNPWRLARTEALIFAMGTTVHAYCTCGHGQAMRRDGVQPAGTSRDWHVRICTRDELAARETWRREEPARFAQWPPNYLLAECPRCKNFLRLNFDPNHEPGAAPSDEESPRTHCGECSCGVTITVDLPADQEPDYEARVAAWQAREPKIEDWHLPEAIENA